MNQSQPNSAKASDKEANLHNDDVQDLRRLGLCPFGVVILPNEVPVKPKATERLHSTLVSSEKPFLKTATFVGLLTDMDQRKDVQSIEIKRPSAASKANCLNLKGKLQEEGFLDDDTMKRYVTYESLWKETADVSAAVFSNVYDKLLRDCVEHIGKLPVTELAFVNPASSEALTAPKLPVGYRCVPTVAVVLSSNLSDHGKFFDELCDKRLAEIGVLSARLRSSDCLSTKQTMQHVVQAFVSHRDRHDLFQGARSFRELCEWYRKTYFESGTASSHTHRKRSKSDLQRPPILAVVIEDLESFSAQILKDLILIAADYQEELPIVFIFGVATASTTVHNLLPHLVTSKISIEAFCAPSPSEFLCGLIERLFITVEDKLPFKLGGNVLGFLTERFDTVTFDASGFVCAIRLCMLQHFLDSPASMFCDIFEEFRGLVEEPSPDLQRILRELPSIGSSLSKKYYKEVLEHHRQLKSYHYCFHVMLRCLVLALQAVPPSDFASAKHISRAYVFLLEEGESVFERDDYATFLSLLRSLSLGEIQRLIDGLRKIIADAMAGEGLDEEQRPICAKTAQRDFSTLEYELGVFKANFADTEAGQKALDKERDAAKKAEEAKAKLAKKETLESLKEKLRSAAKANKESNYFELERERFVECLDSAFRTFLKHPSTQPLYEVFYFDDLDSIANLFSGSQNIAVETRLVEIANSAVNGEHLESKTASDMAIAYKLYGEGGRKISLASWFESFCELIKVYYSVFVCREFLVCKSKMYYLFCRTTRYPPKPLREVGWRDDVKLGEIFRLFTPALKNAEAAVVLRADEPQCSMSSGVTATRSRRAVKKKVSTRFIGSNEPPTSASKATEKTTLSEEEELLARFYRCVAQLELLGYVKSSIKTPGKVTRLRFGCLLPN